MTIEQEKSELARILGVERIATQNPAWLRLMREGVIVRLHIRRWRAVAKLTHQDLGLPREADDMIGDLLALGQKRLLPKELAARLEAIESAGRKALERAGYATYWGDFLGVTAYETWRTANTEYRARYLAVRDEIVNNYDHIIEHELLPSYRKAARAAYQRVNAISPLSMTAEERTDQKCFVLRFVSRIRGLIPTAQQIYDSFAWEEELSYIPLPSLLAEDAAEAERIRAQRDRERLEEELARDEVWREIAIRDEADRARRQMLARMNEDVVAEARQKKQELIDTFLQDLVVQLRTLIYEATTDVIGAIERGQGKLHPRSVVQLRNLVEQVGRLNFFGDTEAEQMIARVREIFEKRPALRNVGDLKETLTDVAIVVRSSLLALGVEPRAARMLGDPQLGTEDNLERARRRLEIGPEPSPVPTDAFLRAVRQPLFDLALVQGAERSPHPGRSATESKDQFTPVEVAA